ncbi:MAG: hypothetical protein A2W90_17630 [Bacteroidetes bacterium GWF2_42_66]|nr:MAG: hypothetical protein A2W92_16715 [Bacteroidetes bacterium GWA2_42_15]OFX98080.1 MAG: hypothetical protein A2W89_09120 [Bacteroidetes bacterium GWE2_42_39]OFY42463.1 MAG: hypothetical protein A2W90_17630 [Bacteroidetes bacterium GWF2_42_66]HBL74174.1 molybdopterin molybdenumtransferase MoeA [Prolixibacteraceae bacterium]HCR91660.1 molybdopterin molybdenumtransferase MoeA [Prolixibacteraceae bacterium]
MENQVPMISLQEALAIATKQTVVMQVETLDYLDSQGRILAENVFSDVDMPPFNKSAMDGYACRKDDLGKELELLEIIAAGKMPTQTIGAGQCSKIMTGAKVPDGADLVFMVEQSERLPNGKIRFTGEKTSANICVRGEDVQSGDRVLAAGIKIEPQHIAILASVGCIRPVVYCRPTVGIISTGSELIIPSGKPNPAQIRNSNGPQLEAQVRKMGLPVCNYGIVPDVQDETFRIIQKSVHENDVTLISGGVSVGDFDYVPLVIQQLGFTVHFNKLSVKPGKHTTFASMRNDDGQTKYIIGLPGNPVSSFIQFEIFAKVFLNRLMNFSEKHFYLPLPLAHDFRRRKSDRDEFLPVSLTENNEVEIIRYNGSAHIHAYHGALGFVLIEKGVEEITKGSFIHVRPL